MIPTDKFMHSGKKFIASYSGGKDSTLAIYRAIKYGLIPLGLITTYNTDLARSWFHGIPESILNRVSESVAIPLELIRTSGSEYEKSFESALEKAKQNGAQVCVFGDIDIEGHLEWCSRRCENIGLIPFFPLWKEGRKDLVYEFIDSGFSAVITTVDRNRLDEKFLGKTLDRATAGMIEDSGADICGENGEYHSFAYDGPIFAKKVAFNTGRVIRINNYSVLPVVDMLKNRLAALIENGKTPFFNGERRSLNPPKWVSCAIFNTSIV